LIGAATLQLGATAGIFSRREDSDELAKCQRFFEKSYEQDVALATITLAGAVHFSASVAAGSYSYAAYRVAKRVAASTVFYNPNSGVTGQARDITANTDRSVNSQINGFHGVSVNVTPQAANDSLAYHYAVDAEL